jgi:hypothetical protein
MQFKGGVLPFDDLQHVEQQPENIPSTISGRKNLCIIPGSNQSICNGFQKESASTGFPFYGIGKVICRIQWSSTF